MNLVTGATGFLGSHLVERLVHEGQPVRVLTRPFSDPRFLDGLRVEKVVGDLTDIETVERACRGVEVVYHAAAKVGEWGPWTEFQRHTVEATRNLAEAARRASVRRFVHVSSISAYGDSNRKDLVLDETAPLGGHSWRWNHYGRAKAQAEKDLWRLHEETGFPLTVIRSGWIYGPRDRAIFPRLHRLLVAGKVPILGDGHNLLSVVFVGNLVDACLLAAAQQGAVGQAYNCSSDGPITQREFLNLWADALGCPRPVRTVPYRLAFSAAVLCEYAAHLFGSRTAPSVTRYGIWILGRRLRFPTDKIRQQLGWRPAVSYAEGFGHTARWYASLRQDLRTGSVSGI